MKKSIKIKGGIYSGYWADYFLKKEAKKFAHRQDRQKAKKICKNA